MSDPRNITGKPNDTTRLVDSKETDKSSLNRPISNYPGITQGIVDLLDNVVTGDISLKMDIETGWYTTQSGEKIYLENKGDDLYHVEKLYGKQNPTKDDVDNRGIEC